MINCEQLKECIIVPALSKLNMYSDSAVELLLFTCAVESQGGTYLKQTKGPALGIYQMEPLTYTDLWNTYIRRRSDVGLILATQFSCFQMPFDDRMVYDLMYATAIARIFYHRVKDQLPAKDDIDGIWQYYKTFWNTEKGKSEKDPSIKAYLNFVELPQPKSPKKS